MPEVDKDASDVSGHDAPPKNGEENNAALNKVAVLHYKSPRNRDASDATTFYVVGTAHISKSSCNLVQDVVRDVKPDAVFLELCEHRTALLRDMKDLRIPPMSEVLTNLKQGKTTLFEVLYSWMLSNFGSKLEVMPGEEFRVAFKEAQAIDARVVLGDRPVPITIARMWSGLTSWQKVKLYWHLFTTGINPSTEEMNKLFDEWAESDAMTEAIKELSRTFPSMAKHLIDERDLYMVHTMRQIASSSSKVVAVVGAGHLPGITANWESDIDIKELSSMPPKKPPSHKLRYAVLITGGLAVAAVVILRSRGRR
ncbi:hypothetical protein BSKO_04008 [Bryopsis sp. KO-2023]|nr:hypothetical protein BSKO_04008 [Bryopsis sp. KO-2023]